MSRYSARLSRRPIRFPAGGLLGLLLWGVCLAGPGPAAALPGRLVFQRPGDDRIWLSDLSARKPLSVARGADPEISPEGTRVAFTRSDSRGGRTVAVLDLESRSLRVLPLPGDNSYGPRWSPDGKLLVFNHWDRKTSNWTLGVAAPDGTGLRLFPPLPGGVYSPAWDPRGEGLYAQDLRTLYRFDLSGTVTERRPLKEVLGNLSPDSALRLCPLPDGAWLFDGARLDASHPVARAVSEPASEVGLLLPGGERRRLSPSSLSASHPSPLADGGAVFDGFGVRDVTGKGEGLRVRFRLYRVDPQGKATPLGLEGMHPSCSVR